MITAGLTRDRLTEIADSLELASSAVYKPWTTAAVTYNPTDQVWSTACGWHPVLPRAGARDGNYSPHRDRARLSLTNARYANVLRGGSSTRRPRGSTPLPRGTPLPARRYLIIDAKTGEPLEDACVTVIDALGVSFQKLLTNRRLLKWSNSDLPLSQMADGPCVIHFTAVHCDATSLTVLKAGGRTRADGRGQLPNGLTGSTGAYSEFNQARPDQERTGGQLESSARRRARTDEIAKPIREDPTTAVVALNSTRLAEGQLRVVLRWTAAGANTDLDLHCLASAGGVGCCWEAKAPRDDLRLDVDSRAQTRGGPETITIDYRRGERYAILCHNFDGCVPLSKDLVHTSATITLHAWDAPDTPRVFTVPTSPVRRLVWHPFDIVTDAVGGYRVEVFDRLDGARKWAFHLEADRGGEEDALSDGVGEEREG